MDTIDICGYALERYPSKPSILSLEYPQTYSAVRISQDKPGQVWITKQTTDTCEGKPT